MVPEGTGWCTVTAIDKKLHRQKRKLFGQAISHSHLESFIPRICDYLTTFCDELVQDVGVDGWSMPKNMIIHCTLFSNDSKGESGTDTHTQARD